MKTPNHIDINTVYTWVINISDVLHKLEELTLVINVDENYRANKFRFEKDKNLFIITRAALRLLSGKYLKVKPESINFKYGKYGKPDYDFETELKFNISHSGNLAVIAFVLNADIGIDIEEIKSDFDVLNIVDKYFSNLEIESLKKLPKSEQSRGFYRCWTRKESFIKAKAKGLSFPLDSFSVSINSDKKTELLETKWDNSEKQHWTLSTFTPSKNYLGAISVNTNIKSLKYFNFNSLI